MRWQKVARGVVAIAGLGTAVAVYVFTRPRPVDTRPVGRPAGDPTATVQSGAGTYVRQDGSRTIGRVDYEALSDHPDGRVDWTNATFTLEDGTTMSADLVEGKGKAAKGDQPSELTLTGHARLHTVDGTLLQGDAGSYSDVSGIATIPGAAAFTHGRMSGTGTGGSYERAAGVFRLLADTKVTTAAENPGDAPIEATSQSMTFVRASKSMLFEDHARVARSAETLTADRATLYLTDDEQRFRAMELRGNSKVTPAPGKVSDLPDMQADDIDLNFYPDGQAVQRAVLNGHATMIMTNDQGRRSIEGPHVTFGTAPDGKTLTSLDAPGHVIVKTPASAGVPERTITAASLSATGNEKSGLTAAVFDGGVQFDEHVPAAGGRPEANRRGTSQTLTMTLKGQLDAIDEAHFQRDTTFRDGDVVGDADLGVYRAAQGELDLLPVAKGPRRLPHVTDGTVTVDAAEIITIDLDTQDLHARREVKTVSKGSGADAGASKDTGIFNAQETLYGFGAEFWYTAASKSARYIGASGAPAQLRQGDSLVKGGEVIFSEDTQDLSAEGHVDSTFRLTAGSPPGNAKAPDSYHVIADTLAYADATRTASTGSLAMLTSPQGDTKAASIVLVLAKEGRTLERLDAGTSVHTIMQGGREAFGDSLVYEVEKDLYTLKGRPLTLLTKDSDGTCSIQNGSLVRFSSGTGAPDFPAADNPPGGTQARSKQPCAAPKPASGAAQ